jgi:hypothetical protein
MSSIHPINLPEWLKVPICLKKKSGISWWIGFFGVYFGHSYIST